jgi:hypothetical protein
VKRFANVLGRRIDSPEAAEFLKTWRAKAVIYRRLEAGEITVHKHGFDAILALDEAFGKPRGGGKSNAWICTIRLFSPVYCEGKRIQPYEGEIVAGLRFPLTRKIVRQQFRKPARTRKIPNFDEFVFSGCNVRFVYRAEDQVAFVELERARGAK